MLTLLLLCVFQGIPVLAGLGPGGPDPPNQRLVHLDLKGAPPKVCHVIFLLFQSFGVVK